MVTVIICDDHEMYLQGTKLLLQQNHIATVATASTGSGLLQVLEKSSCDILLLDVHLPDYKAADLLAAIRKQYPAQKIIYLTMMRGSRNVHRLKDHEIQGYLLKNAPVKELLFAIDKVNGGGTYFSNEASVINDENDYRKQISVDESKTNEILTKREIEILKMICAEMTNAEIAAKLFLSTGTVDTHRKNIINKLGVKNTVGLVRYALKNQLLD
jgi:two-component system, NarL family, response regulator NreC